SNARNRPDPSRGTVRVGRVPETPPFEPSSARGGVLRFEAGHRTALGTLPSQYSRCPAGFTTAVACRVRSSLHAFERHRQLTLRSLANAKERPLRRSLGLRTADQRPRSPVISRQPTQPYSAASAIRS